MASFREEDFNRFDFCLLQNGFINLYWRPGYLAEDTDQLLQLGYKVIRFDCSSWKSLQDCARDVSAKLDFQWQGNLNALNDLLSDIQIPFESGLIISFLGFEKLQKLEPDIAWPMLDMLANNARRHLLFGKRLICMVQVDEPRTSFEPVGAQRVNWNPREWMNKDRGL